MKKVKFFYIIVVFICMAVIFDCLFCYKNKVYAAFQDKDIVTTDIKLELGNVDLEFNNPDQISKEYINLKTNNEPVHIHVPEIKNQGSLDGKIFYRIDLYQMEDGEKIKVPDEMIDHPSNKFELTVQSNGIESNKVTSDEVGNFLPVLDKNSQSLILQSDEMIQTELFFSSNNMNHLDGYQIELTFFMMQTNGTLENPMFHDEVSMSYEIKLNKKDGFWPVDNEVKTAGSFKYAIELPETFYFTERRVDRFIFKDDIYHTSTNSGILYLESNKTINNWKEVAQSQNPSMSIYDIEVSDNRAKIYFYLDKKVTDDDKKRNETLYSEKSKFSLKETNQKSFDTAYFEYSASRLFLSSDSFNFNEESLNEESINLRDSDNEIIWLQYFTKKENKLKINNGVFEVNSIKASISMDVWSWPLNIPLQIEEDKDGAKIKLRNDWWIRLLDELQKSDKFKLQITLSDPKGNELVISRKLTYTPFWWDISNNRRIMDDTQINNLNDQKEVTFKQSLPQTEVDLDVNEAQNSKQEIPALKEEHLTEIEDFVSGNQKEIEKELPPDQTKDSSELIEEIELNPLPSDEENSSSENQEEVEKEVPQDQTEESLEQDKELDINLLPIDEDFKYIPITLNEQTYNIGVTQNQFNWLLNFKTIQEFSDQLTEDTPSLYVKYDQVTGIEDFEQFVYQLAEEKQLDFEIKLKDIPEQKLLEITFTK